MAKITLATLKSFIKENDGEIYVNITSSFNGMTDGVERVDGGFFKSEKDESYSDHKLGYQGIWMVGRSNDRISEYSDEIFEGYSIYNSCGSFIVAKKKLVLKLAKIDKRHN